MGRPSNDTLTALAEHMLKSAEELFLTRGFAESSMAMVASVAKIGKQTLYSRHPDKESLFRAVVMRHLEQTSLSCPEWPTEPDPLVSLRRLADTILEFLLAPGTVGLLRIAVAEAARFPDLPQIMLNRLTTPSIRLCVGAIKAAQLAGRLSPCSAETLAHQYFWTLAGGALPCALLGVSKLSVMESREGHIDTVWRIFILGKATST